MKSKSGTMRHRVTFVHPLSPEDDVVESLNSTYVGLKNDFKVAREDRYTFPSKGYENLKSIRILVNKGYEDSSITSPFSYRSQIGSHFYVKPELIRNVEEREEFYNNSAQMIADYFGVKPIDQEWVPALNSLYFHVQEPLALNFEKMEASLSTLSEDWNSLDYLFSDESSTLKLFHANANKRSVDVSETSDYTEVGIFAIEDHSTRDDLILSGARVVFNDESDSELVQRTLFHVKPRHRSLSPMNITLEENGLHPIVSFGPVPEHPVEEDIKKCILYSYLTLEKSVFLDPYQIPLGFNILANYGTKDLELPEYAVSQWGNEILVELNDTCVLPFELALHTRYQMPSSEAHKNVSIDRPLVFYACEGSSDAYLLSNSPFDNKKTPGGSYEKFFTDDTIFYHTSYPGNMELRIPTSTSSLQEVNLATVVALLLGVLFISYRLLRKANSREIPQTKKDE